ncbi:MAG: hypothetical protein H6832_05420 [Planctomycetes bacterium]|nr:hypothetical protein [Planctomycetota bacterium]MCB9917822.1 hypothetical protein [Planctomycetota bacterium]
MADMFSIDGDDIATERRLDRPKPSPRALAAFQAIFKTPDEPAPERQEPEPQGEVDQDASESADDREGQSSGALESEARSARAYRGTTHQNGAPVANPTAAATPRAATVIHARTESVDRPQSPFHTYDWVLGKLRDKPSMTFLEIRRLADRGRFEVSEGHYKRARQAIAGELPIGGSSKIDAIVEDTIALLREPIHECKRFRDAAHEIAAICERVLRELGEHD